MGNKDAKKAWKASVEVEKVQAARLRPRLTSEDLPYGAGGIVRLRVVRLPSFEKTVAWEIRGQSELSLFRSESAKIDEWTLVGDARHDAPQDALSNVLRRLSELTVPMPPLVEQFGTMDGVRLELYVQLEQARVALRWEEMKPPSGWRAIESFAWSLFEQFARYPAIEAAGFLE